jgi:hypothetical protein
MDGYGADAVRSLQRNPLIGRERECEVLRSAVARVVDGAAGFLLLVGEPGIGKSTLLRTLAELAEKSGLTVGSGRGRPDETAPLWSWCSALASIASSRGHPADASGALGNPGVEREAGLDGGGAERVAFREQFAQELSLSAAQGPVALLLDDLHCADVSALRLFHHLLDHPSLNGVLVAAALRTTEPLAADVSELVSELIANPLTDVVELTRFDAGEIAAFAEQTLSLRLSDADVGVVARRCGGNPFLLGELLRWAPPGGSAADLDAALPLAVRESVRRRLVIERPVTQQAVKATAVAGSAASLDLLMTITGVDRVELGSALDSAVRAGFLAVDEGGSVWFVHDLIREAVISLLATWERTQLHHARCDVQRLVREGDTWLVEFGGGRARLQEQRGLHHLQVLLARPGVEIPAVTLAAADHSMAGSSEATILDDRAMREYRQRIIDLHEDIDEATTNNDIERAARAEAELDALVAELASATGVGGRSRRFTGADERARVSVTKAIRSAICHLGKQLPALGHHLTATVRTGHRCVYQPDPRVPHRWATERM